MDETNESDPDIEAAVDVLIAEFGGDLRDAIRALLHDIDILASDYGANVSRGFIRTEKTIVLRTISVRRAAKKR